MKLPSLSFDVPGHSGTGESAGAVLGSDGGTVFGAASRPGEQGTPQGRPAGFNLSGISPAGVGASVRLIDNCNAFCLAQIGNSDRFCTLPCAPGLNWCGPEFVKAHGTARKALITNDTFYVASGDSRAYCSPCLFADEMPRGVSLELLATTRSAQKWASLFNSLGKALNDGVSEATLLDIIGEVDRVEDLTPVTPAKPKGILKVEHSPESASDGSVVDVAEWTDEELYSLVEDFNLLSNEDKHSRVLSHVQLLLSTVRKLTGVAKSQETDLQALASRVSGSSSIVGERKDHQDYPALSLWGSVACLSGEVEVLKVQNKSLTEQLNLAKVTAKEAAEAEVEVLRNEFTQVLASFGANINQSVHKIVAGSIGTGAAGPQASGISNSLLDFLKHQVKESKGRIQILENQAGGERFVVVGHCFDSVKDAINLFSSGQVPPEHVRFVTDVVSLLEQMSAMQGNFQGNLQLAHQIGKSGYQSSLEAAVLESFSIEVPGVFQKGVGKSDGGLSAKALQLIEKPEDWTSLDSENGLFYRINEHLEQFKESTEETMEQYYGSGSHAMLFKTLLVDSIEATRQICNWISEFYNEMSVKVGVKEQAWSLTMTILHGLFKELKKVRQTAGQVSALWRTDQPRAAGMVLWASLKSRKFLKTVLAYRVSGHPQLASHIMQFLITHSATKVGLKKLSDTVTKSVQEVKSQAALAKAAADRAASLRAKPGGKGKDGSKEDKE